MRVLRKVLIWTRRIFLALLLLVLVAILVGVTTRIDESLAEALVRRELGVEAEVGALEWKLDGVRARRVTASFPDRERAFFGVESADLDLGFAPPRVRSIVLTELALVATERPDGTIDLGKLAREAGGDRPAPSLEIERGTLELRGEGPLHRSLHRVLSENAATTVSIERFVVTPRKDRGAGFTGEIVLLAPRARVQLQGSIEGGRLRRAVARVLPSDAIELGALRQVVAPEIASWLEANALIGPVAVEVTVDGSESGPRISADVELRGVTIRPEAFPVTVSDLHGWVRLDGDSLRLDQVSGRHGPATISILGETTQLTGDRRSHAELRIHGGAFDDELRAALARDRVGRDVLAALDPEGRFSVTVTIDADRHEDPRVTLDLDLQDCAGAFHGFEDQSGERHGLPLRIERIRGHVFVAEHETRFERAVGFTRSGARVEASAHLQGRDVEGEVHVLGAPIDEELLVALDEGIGPGVREVVAMLGLSGRLDASARFAQRSGRDGGDDFELEVELEPREIWLEPPEFPFRTRLDRGVAVVRPDRVELHDLRGAAGEGSIGIEGQVAILEKGQQDPPLDLLLTARGVPIDEALIAAARKLGGERIAPHLDALARAGTIDADVRWVRGSLGGPLELSVKLVPRDLAIHVGDGAAELGRVSGAITIVRRGEGRFDVDLERDGGLSGTLLDGFVRVSGRMDAEGKGALTVRGSRLRIGEELQRALEPIAPDLAGFLAKLQAQGRVRLSCDLAPAADGRGELRPRLLDIEPDVTAAVDSDEPHGIHLVPPWRPLPLQWSAGTMRIDLDAHTATFDRLTGLIGDAHLRLDEGTIELGDDGVTVGVSVFLDGLPFRQCLELVLGEKAAAALADQGPLGRTRVALRQVDLHVRKGGSMPDRLTLYGDVDLEGWTFYTGGGLRELSGRLEVLDFRMGEGGLESVRADGRLAGTTLQLGPARLTDLGCDLVLTEGRLTLEGIHADFAGGRLPRERNHLAFDLLGRMPWSGRLELKSADLSRVTGDEPTQGGLVGRIDAEVGLRGSLGTFLGGGGFSDLEAAGTIAIHDAKLWKIPVFDQLYEKAIIPLVGLTEVDGGRREPPKWTRGELEFELRGPRVHLSRVELEGEPLVLRGEGVLGPDGLELHFYPEVKTAIGWLRGLPIVGYVVNLIFGFVEQQFGAFRFHGPYESPAVDWQPISIVPRPGVTMRLERPRTSSRNDPAPERF